MKKIIAKLVSVTPDYAATLLEKNTTNRNISQITVKRYAQAMASGEWMQNGQTITIAEDGTILDGQHRLWAVIESGITITFLIVFNVKKDFLRAGALCFIFKLHVDFLSYTIISTSFASTN